MVLALQHRWDFLSSTTVALLLAYGNHNMQVVDSLAAGVALSLLWVVSLAFGIPTWLWQSGRRCCQRLMIASRPTASGQRAHLIPSTTAPSPESDADED